MQYFRHDVAGDTLTLYPLVCWHLGAAQSDMEFIAEHVARIDADPNGRWVYLGDGGECVTRASKGSVYAQTMSPDDQLELFVEMVTPIREKGLFGVSGNHDRRISHLSGLDWTHQLCARLGIPYLGMSAMARFCMERNSSRLAFDTFWHHGTSSGRTLSSKINAGKRLEELVECDAIFSAHSHICQELTPTYRAYIKKRGGIAQRETRNYLCGCAYDSTVPGYAEEKGYSPILPAHLAVTLSYWRDVRGSGDVLRKQMEHRIFRASPREIP